MSIVRASPPATASSASPFDAIYTAEDVGSYKPDPRNFAYLLAHLEADLGLKPRAEVLHTAPEPASMTMCRPSGPG
jgi:hypothetical protein